MNCTYFEGFFNNLYDYFSRYNSKTSFLIKDSSSITYSNLKSNFVLKDANDNPSLNTIVFLKKVKGFILKSKREAKIEENEYAKWLNIGKTSLNSDVYL